LVEQTWQLGLVVVWYKIMGGV